MSYHNIFGLKKNRQVISLGLGIFDGIHRGHQEIARHCTDLLTFYPHPDIFLSKNRHLKMISTLREQRYYFKNLLVLRFSSEIAKSEPDTFLTTIIKNIINPRTIVVGQDFRFGYQHKGDTDTLAKWAGQNDIKVKIIPLYALNNIPVKSSNIRTLIEQDQFNTAVKLLNHPYLIIGKVIHGEGRGTAIGFPTANIKIPDNKLIPSTGVYTGTTVYKQQNMSCLVYIGKKPTYNFNQISLEVHIPDFNENLYNMNLKVLIEQKIRDEIKFSNTNELVKQISSDLTHIPGNSS
ncbi:MAG: riboflavin biosynthesis protein RibF [bacterium]|nr:riboflavin biosynthesis protein RibF [bacterium]